MADADTGAKEAIGLQITFPMGQYLRVLFSTLANFFWCGSCCNLL